MSADTGDDANPYEVGYGKPPRSGQFQKGRSGNPTGRPKKAKAASNRLPLVLPTQKILEKVARKSVRVREGGDISEVTLLEAVIQGLFNKAAQGGTMAARTIIDLLAALDEARHVKQLAAFERMKALMKARRTEIEAARRRGMPLPEPVPHPDDVIFDEVELSFRVVGPISESAVESCKREGAIAQLLIEILLHQGIENPEEIVNPGPKVTYAVLLLTLIVSTVPKRFLARTDEHDAGFRERHWMGPARRRTALRDHGRSIGFPYNPDRLFETVDLRAHNLRIRNCQLEFFRWPKEA